MAIKRASYNAIMGLREKEIRSSETEQIMDEIKDKNKEEDKDSLDTKDYSYERLTELDGSLEFEEEEKNIEFLINSQKKLVDKHNNIKLIIVGDGPDKEEYEEYREYVIEHICIEKSWECVRKVVRSKYNNYCSYNSTVIICQSSGKNECRNDSQCRDNCSSPECYFSYRVIAKDTV